MIETSTKTQDENYLYWPLEALAVYIQSAQEKLLTTKLPFLKEQFAVVCDLHSKTHPEIVAVFDYFIELSDDLYGELSNDTEVTLPYICKLAESHRLKMNVDVPAFSSIAKYASTWRSNQRATLSGMNSIIEMILGLQTFGGADPEDNALIGSLKDFVSDLDSVVTLKFEILFQRAREMENTVGRNLCNSALSHTFSSL